MSRIVIKEVSKVYKNKAKDIKALDDVSFEVTSGEIVCVLGHNGAGKTTLIKMICGLLKPTSGSIEIDDINIINNMNYAHEKCGAVLEGARNIYYYMSARENIEYFGLLNGLDKNTISKKSDYYLELFGLKEFANSNVGTFSRGMQQKLAIIIALIKDPKIILLDEPTLGLDIITSESIKDIIRNLAKEFNKTIIVTTHDIDFIESINSRTIFMRKGEVIKDTTLGSLKKGDTISIYKVVFKGDGVLPKDAVINTSEGDVIEFETKDEEWVSNNISNASVLQLEKNVVPFADIYRSVMENEDE